MSHGPNLDHRGRRHQLEAGEAAGAPGGSFDGHRHRFEQENIQPWQPGQQALRQYGAQCRTQADGHSGTHGAAEEPETDVTDNGALAFAK